MSPTTFMHDLYRLGELTSASIRNLQVLCVPISPRHHGFTGSPPVPHLSSDARGVFDHINVRLSEKSIDFVFSSSLAATSLLIDIAKESLSNTRPPLATLHDADEDPETERAPLDWKGDELNLISAAVLLPHSLFLPLFLDVHMLDVLVRCSSIPLSMWTPPHLQCTFLTRCAHAW